MLSGSRAFAQRVLNQPINSNHHSIYLFETEKILQEFVNLRKIEDYKVYIRKGHLDLYVHTWERGIEHKFSYYIQQNISGTCRSSHTKTTYEIRYRVEQMFKFSRLSREALGLMVNPPTEIEMLETALISQHSLDSYMNELYHLRVLCLEILALPSDLYRSIPSREFSKYCRQYSYIKDIPKDYEPILDIIRVQETAPFTSDLLLEKIENYYSSVKKILRNYTIDDHIPIIMSYLRKKTSR